MTTAPEHPLDPTNELGFSQEQLRHLLESWERLQPHLDGSTTITIVGGLANRINFPTYAELIVPRKNPDLDLLLPFSDPEQRTKRLIRPSVQEDFVVTSIIPDTGAYYFQLIDRLTRTKVDCFVPPRFIQTHVVRLNGQSLTISTPEEAYLKVSVTCISFCHKSGRLMGSMHSFLSTQTSR